VVSEQSELLGQVVDRTGRVRGLVPAGGDGRLQKNASATGCAWYNSFVRDQGGSMNFAAFIDYLVNLVQSNPPLSIAAGVLMGLTLVKKPKLFITAVSISAVLGGVIYLITMLANPGVSHKNKIVSNSAVDRAP
jgi:hypothetical protein